MKTSNNIILTENNQQKELGKFVKLLAPTSLTSLKVLIFMWQKKINHLKMKKTAD